VNFSLLLKFCRDVWVVLVVVLVAIVLFEVLWINTITEIPRDLVEQWMRQPFVKRFVSSLLGADIAETLSVNGLVAFGFAAPFMLICTWTFLIVATTRLVAEIEKGTAELLLTLPVHRTRIYGHLCLAWAAGAILLALAPLLGASIGVRVVKLFEPVQMDRVAMISVHLAALNLAIGGLGMLASALFSRRGVAIGVVAAILLSSFMFNFLGERWPLMDKLSAFGPLHYYKPLIVVRTGQWQTRDIVVLLTAGAALLFAGLLRYRARDIPAA
jgi:ABC-2 type transport system permease protein